jgi:hypothetical protein
MPTAVVMPPLPQQTNFSAIVEEGRHQETLVQMSLLLDVAGTNDRTFNVKVIPRGEDRNPVPPMLRVAAKETPRLDSCLRVSRRSLAMRFSRGRGRMRLPCDAKHGSSEPRRGSALK